MYAQFDLKFWKIVIICSLGKFFYASECHQIHVRRGSDVFWWHYVRSITLIQIGVFFQGVTFNRVTVNIVIFNGVTFNQGDFHSGDNNHSDLFFWYIPTYIHVNCKMVKCLLEKLICIFFQIISLSLKKTANHFFSHQISV